MSTAMVVYYTMVDAVAAKCISEQSSWCLDICRCTSLRLWALPLSSRYKICLVILCL